jgi:hypothetical protein
VIGVELDEGFVDRGIVSAKAAEGEADGGAEDEGEVGGAEDGGGYDRGGYAEEDGEGCACYHATEHALGHGEQSVTWRRMKFGRKMGQARNRLGSLKKSSG